MNRPALELRGKEGLAAGRVELWMSSLLRFGTIASLCFVAAGAGLTFFHHPDYLWSSEALARVTSPQSGPHDLSLVLWGLAEARGRAVTMVGILLLITLPVLRLVVAFFGFRAEGDRQYTQLTLLVLCLLVLSFTLGASH